MICNDQFVPQKAVITSKQAALSPLPAARQPADDLVTPNGYSMSNGYVPRVRRVRKQEDFVNSCWTHETEVAGLVGLGTAPHQMEAVPWDTLLDDRKCKFIIPLPSCQ